MANAYSGGNFNIDTGTNVAGLTTLKGSAPALTDAIYIYNGATLTVESALSVLKIYLGQTSSGAAGAGNRYGILAVNAGVTVTFAGNATATNSGIQMNPTTADASSKGCQLNINGTSASRVIFTVDGGALDANKRWIINQLFGQCNIVFADFRLSYGSPITLALTTTRSNSGCIVTDCLFDALGSATAANLSISLSFLTIDLQGDFRRNTFNISGPANQYLLGNGQYAFASGGSVDYTGSVFTGATSGLLLIATKQDPKYMNLRFAYSNIAPTTTIPTTLAFTDLADGTVKVTVSNIASIAATDMLVVFDASNNRRYSISRTRYEAALDRKPANCGIIAGVPLSAMTGWYAQYTSDNSNFSASSAVADTVTPTFLPAIGNVRPVQYGQSGTEFTGDLSGLAASDAAYVALEATRNKFNTGTTVADLLVTKSVKIAGADNEGTFDEAARNTATVAIIKKDENVVLLGVADVGEYEGAIPTPTAPVISGIEVNPNQIDLQWSFSGYVEYFVVERSINGGAWAQIGANVVDAVDYSDTDVKAGYSYRYRVTATNSTAGTVSNIITIEIETVTDKIDREALPFRANPYLGKVRAPIKLWRMYGGNGIDYRKLRQNFEIIEASLAGLNDSNFRSYAEIARSKIESIVTQDEIAITPNFDATIAATHPTRNRIPRLDGNGGVSIGMNSTAMPYNCEIINDSDTSGISVKDSIGAFRFRAGGSIIVYLSATAGWTIIDEPSESPSTYGWAIIFDDTRSLWLFYKDNTIIGVIDGNVSVDAFKTAVPTTTYPTLEAYIDLDNANSRVAFFCRNNIDTSIRLCGYIDATGTH